MDRKYRPKTFAEVLGQEKTKLALRRTLERNEFQPAYLFSGPFGSGKTTVARIFARAILCKNRIDGYEPCNQCPSCLNVLNQESYSYTEINAADVTKVEDIREILERTSYKSIDSDHRIYLFDESHMLSKASQNLLLKPLEDPAPNVHWFFCTTEREKMLETIRSRCQPYQITPVATDTIVERLEYICAQEKIDYDKEALTLIVNAKRHLRDILKLLEKLRVVGGATTANVNEYLNINLYQIYFEILLTMRADLPKAIQTAEESLDKISPQELWRGLGIAAMDAYKFGLGLAGELPMGHTTFPKEVYEAYRDSLVKISEYVSTRKSLDRHLLACELVNLRQRLDNNFVEATKVTNQSQNVVQPSVAVQSVMVPQTSAAASAMVMPTAPSEPKPTKTKKVQLAGPLTKLDGLGLRPAIEVSTQTVPESTELKINPEEFTPLSFEAFRDLFTRHQ